MQQHKKCTTRIVSFVLMVAMVFSLFPSAALAIEGTTELPATCTCTEACTTDEVNADCPICKDALVDCLGTEPAPEAPSESTPEAPSEGTPEAPSESTPEAPSEGTPEAPSETAPETCICTANCTEEKANTACSVCVADWKNCTIEADHAASSVLAELLENTKALADWYDALAEKSDAVDENGVLLDQTQREKFVSDWETLIEQADKLQADNQELDIYALLEENASFTRLQDLALLMMGDRMLLAAQPPTVVGGPINSVSGNGTALVITGSGQSGTIYCDNNRNGKYDSGEAVVPGLGSNADLSYRPIAGGGGSAITGDTMVTLNGSEVAMICGGGFAYSGGSGNVTGNTNVTILDASTKMKSFSWDKLRGGDVFGGGYTFSSEYKADVTGDTNVTVSGGTIAGSVFGGGQGGDVSGNTNVTVNGTARVSSNVYGSGRNQTENGEAIGAGGNVQGTATITIGGSAFISSHVYAAGLAATGLVQGNAVVNFTGGGVGGYVFGGAKGTNTINVSGNPRIGTANATAYGIAMDQFTSKRVNIVGNLDATASIGLLPPAGVTQGTILAEAASDSIVFTAANFHIASTSKLPVYKDGKYLRYGTAPKPSVDAATRCLYGNGLKLLIRGTDDTHTTVYWDENGDGVCEKPVSGADNIDLSGYAVFGASHNQLLSGDTHITMESGKVGTIYGGSHGQGVASHVTGDTYIEIKGGTVGSVFGGGTDTNTTATAQVKGNTYVSMTGGTVTGGLNGGGASGATVNGNTTVSVTGGNIQVVLGGGASAVTGTTSVTISGNAVVANAYGGGSSAVVNGAANLTIGGSAKVTGNTIGGGGQSTATVGSTTVTLQENAVVAHLYGGGGAAVPTTVINIKGGTAAGIFGGGTQPVATVNSAVINMGGGKVSSLNGCSSGYAIPTVAATINITGGTVTNNVNGGFGGVYTANTGIHSINVSGNPKIGNGTTDGIDVMSTNMPGMFFNITGPLTGKPGDMTLRNNLTSGTVAKAINNKADADASKFLLYGRTLYTNASSGVISALAGSAESPYVDVADSTYPRVYGRGNALLITEGTTANTTTVYWDKNRNGIVDAGIDTPVHAHVTNADLSKWIINGGWGSETGAKNADSLVTMLGGKVRIIYGGSHSGSMTQTGNINIVVKGGSVESLSGGGNDGVTKGNVTLDISGGTLLRVNTAGWPTRTYGDFTLRLSGNVQIGTEGSTNGLNMAYALGGRGITNPKLIVGQLDAGAHINLTTLSSAVTQSGDVWNYTVQPGATLFTAEPGTTLNLNQFSIVDNRILLLQDSGKKIVLGGTMQSPTVSGNIVYGNGSALLITGTSETATAIYWDKNRNGALDAGETPILSTANLRDYIVCGGSENKATAGNTLVTMLGGRVDCIFGGGNGTASTPAPVNGNTKVVLKGGTMRIVGGGGYMYSDVTGDSLLAITGGSVSYVYAAGFSNEAVRGKASVTIENATVQTISGAGNSDISLGSMEISLGNGAVVQGNVSTTGPAGTNNIINGAKALNISGNVKVGNKATAGIDLSQLTNKKLTITGALTGESGGITLLGLTDPAEGTVVATSTPAGNANAEKFTYVGKALATDGNNVIIANKRLDDLVTVTGYSGLYDGISHKVTATLTGEAVGATVKYYTDAAHTQGETTTAPSAKNVSDSKTYYYTVSKSGYLPLAGSVEFAIRKAPLTVTYPGQRATYTGSAPVLSALTYTGFANGETDAVLKVKPTVSNTNTTPGTYTLTPQGGEADNYTLSYVAGNLIISTASMSEDVSATAWNGAYDGKPHGITVDLKGSAVGATVTYGTTAGNYPTSDIPTYTDVGVYPIYYRVSKPGYNSVIGSAQVIISKKAISVAGVTVDSKDYDGTTTTSSGAMTLNGVVEGENVTANGTITFTDKNAGTNKKVDVTGITLTGTAINNYVLADTMLSDQSTTAEIRALEATLTWQGQSGKTYDGKPAAVYATVSNLLSGDTCTVTVTGGDAIKANAKHIATAVSLSNANYKLPRAATQEYEIKKATLTATYEGATVIFKNAIPTSALKVAVTGFVNGESASSVGAGNSYSAPTVDLSGIAGDKLDSNNLPIVGAYTLTPKDGTATNYTFTPVAGTLNVINRDFDIVTVNDYIGEYDGSAHELAIVNQDAGATNFKILYYETKEAADADTDGSAGSSAAITRTAAGTTPVYFKVGANGYNSTTGSGSITINPKKVTPTLGKKTDKVYDGTADAKEYANLGLDGILPNDDVTLKATSMTFPDKNIGESRTVSASGLSLDGAKKDNYTLSADSASTAISVKPKELTLTWTDGELGYTGTTKTVTATLPTGGLLAGDTENISVMGGSGVNAGSYTASAKLNNENYTLTNATHPYTIAKAMLTAKFKEESITFGNKAALQISVEGFVNGESETTAADYTAPTIATTPIPTHVGTHAITLSGGSAKNYTLTLESGNLIITDASMSGDIVATSYSGDYDGKPHSITVTVPSDATVRYGTTAEDCSSETPGTYTDVTNESVTIYYQVTRENYTAVSGSATVTINKRTVMPTIASVEDKVYDGTTAATGTLLLTNVVGADAVTATGTIAFTSKDASISKTVGVSDMALSGDKASNYTLSTQTLTEQPTTATITPKEIPLIWSGYEDLVYDGKAKDVTATASELIGSDTCVVTVKDGQNILPGNYTAQVNEISNPNYTPKNPAQDYTIANATLSDIVAEPYDAMFDGKSHDGVTVGGMIDGDKVWYSIDGGDNWQETVPQVGPIADTTIKVKVVRANSNDWIKEVIASVKGDPSISIDKPIFDKDDVQKVTVSGSVTQGSYALQSKSFSLRKVGTELWTTLTDTVSGVSGTTNYKQVLTGLDKGTEYELRLTATDKKGHTATDTLRFRTQPDNAPTGAIEGSVTGTGIITVSIEMGNTVVGTLSGLSSGNKFTFSNLPDGEYNLVGTSDQNQRITLMVTVQNGKTTSLEVNLVASKQSTVKVEENAPAVAVDKLPNVFETKTFTENAEAKAAVDGGGSVEIRLTADQAKSLAQITAIKEMAKDQQMGLALDLTVDMFITPKNGLTTTENLPQIETLMTVAIPLPQGTQGKNGYHVYRYHVDTAEELTLLMEGATPKEGSFRVNGGYVYIYAQKFSTYAVTFENAGSPTVPSGPTGPSGGAVNEKHVVIDKGVGGNVTSTPLAPAIGDKVTITVTPDEDYMLGDLTVTDKDGNKVTVTDNGDGIYTYTQPTGRPSTVKVAFVKVEGDPTQNGVGDLLTTSQHMGFMQGDDTGKFRPDATISRAEVAQIFYNLLKDKNGAATQQHFTDVQVDAWYAKAVNHLADLGFIRGKSAYAFDPQAPISRAEFVIIASRFARDASGKISFTDVPQDDWAKDAIGAAVSYGWIQGYADGTFKPKASITRAEAATVVDTMLARTADKAYVDTHVSSLKTFSDLATGHWAYYNIMEASNSHDFTREQGTESWK